MKHALSILPKVICILVVCLTCVESATSATADLSITNSTSTSLDLRYHYASNKLDSVWVDGKALLFPHLNGVLHARRTALGRTVLYVQELVTLPSAQGWTFHHKLRTTKSLTTPVSSESSMKFYGIELESSSMTALPTSINEDLSQVEYLGISTDRHIGRLSIPLCYWEASSTTPVLIVESDFHFDFNSPALSGPTHIQSAITTLNDNVLQYWPAVSMPLAQVLTTSSKSNSLQSDKISDGQWVKITISDEGLYRISAQQLAALGYTITSDKVASIKILGLGGEELPETPTEAPRNQLAEQPIEVVTNGDGSLNEIVFYAAACRGFSYNGTSKRYEHYINHYAEKNGYLLTWGGTAGLRMKALTPPSGEIVNRPNQFTARVFNEEEIVNAYLSGSGRRWFGQQIDGVVPRTFTTKLPGLVNTGTVSYVIDVAHREAMDTQLRALVNVKENGQVLTSIPLRGVFSAGYEEFISCKSLASFEAKNLSSNSNSVLQFEYINPNVPGGGNGFVDFFEVHYPAQMTAVDNQVTLYSDLNMRGITQYTINGFSSNRIYGFDCSDLRNPKVLQNGSTTGGIFSFIVDLDSTSGHRYFVSSSLKSPELEKIEWSDLRNSDLKADVIVISPNVFINSAKSFQTYRMSHSELKVAVVSYESIVNEFGSGIADPTAIRDFIADALRRWSVKPRYVLLWGHGHYDYKLITTQRPNYITNYQTDDVDASFERNVSGVYTSNYTTDDYFVRVVGNDNLIDLAIGRIPVDSPETGEWMVKKIDHYENQSDDDLWRTTTTFVADDGPKSGNESDGTLHVDQSETLTLDSTCVPLDMIQRKIYLSEYPAENIPKGRLKPRVTEDLLSMVNNHGTLFLNWIGHGNPKVWAHETILNRDVTIPDFVNIDKLYFLVAATCDFGRCDMTDSQGGAEMMLLSRRGSAIGTFSSSRVSFSSLNAVIGREIFHQMFTRGSDGHYRRIGDVAMATKQILSSENDQKYFLLGDPTLRLLIPDMVIQFDSLNGKSADSLQTINALSKVRLSGSVRDYTTRKIVSDFNGSATVSLFDTDIIRRFQDPSGMAIKDSSTFRVQKFGGALHRGTYPINSGMFSAEFVVPKDIAFTNTNGRMFAYGQSTDKRYAKGNDIDFLVGGIDASAGGDSLGPEQQIFMDARSFQAGDIVRSNPLLIIDLRDKTGINSTGIGIGHKIEAWIDDNIESIDLSDNYSSSLDDAHKGTATKQLFGLTPGYHTVRSRVWDVLNNYSLARTFFYVGANDSTIESGRIGIYPNPFADAVHIIFTHNQGYSFVLDAAICNESGQKVRSLRDNIASLQAGSFIWDATDDNGNKVAQGSYLLVLQLHSPDGSICVKTALISYIAN